MITNNVTSKRYIGFTKYAIQKRFKGHCDAAVRDDSCYALHESMRKHGIENFSVELIDVCADRPAAARREQELIIELNTHVQNGRGYNMTKGGEGITGLSQTSLDSMAEKHRRENLKPETLEAMRCAKLGRKLSEETRRRQSEVKKGKKFTEEHKKKIGIANSRENCSAEKIAKLQLAAARAVEQLSMDGVVIAWFKSANEASRQTGVHNTNISACCAGRRKHARGFKWRYAENSPVEGVVAPADRKV